MDDYKKQQSPPGYMTPPVPPKFKRQRSKAARAKLAAETRRIFAQLAKDKLGP